jgi:hypothetical protein
MKSNVLPGVPAVESPFFDQIFVSGRFTEEELRVARDLNANGFAVIDFPDEDLAGRADRIRHALHDRYPWEQWHAGGADMRLQDAWRWNADVRALATNEAVMELLTKLYGRRAWPFQTLNFPVGTQQHYHTDSIHFSSVPERFMCGVWLALEDIGPEQGPLEYFAGSHRWPIYTNEHVGVVPDGHTNSQLTYHALWEQLVAATGAQHEEFHPRKGQALIWAANLLHGGMPHRDKQQTRWSQVTHYYFEDCAYYTPMHSDPFHGIIDFRTLTDLSTMQPVHNAFSGTPVSPTFMAGARNGFTPVGAMRQIYRGLRRRLVRR